MKIHISKLNFKGKPYNYATIDKFVSRSAQPQIEDLKWLKEQGVTDIINFRKMYVSNIDFDEQKVVKELGMNYHNIPSVSMYPQKEKVTEFINLINKLKQNNRKIHIHCMAGADRTGMYSFIYKMLNNIGSFSENKIEWINRGLNIKKYPNLIDWAKEFITNYKKIHLPK